jgi:competence protein ComEC
MPATAPIWNKAPFIRLIIPFIGGIFLQWEVDLPVIGLIIGLALTIAGFIVYSLLPIPVKYRHSIIGGITGNTALFFVGALLVWTNDIRHNANWYGNISKDNKITIVRLEEPLTEKPNSYKTLATFVSVNREGKQEEAKGKLIIYFKKDSISHQLSYGSFIAFNRIPEEIKNAGNPGQFDYKRYCLFQGITHQVYLTNKDFELLDERELSRYTDFIYSTREKVVNILETNIKGDKESGLAEALLIGYKNDLDKNLVQAYSNTGVVHIIAISGLHLGLIYFLLLFLTGPLKRIKRMSWLRLIITIACLWIFSILAGAQPSVLRSAVMFSFIAGAEILGRRHSVYNTLALSAFLLLCFNPFYLWDVGYQLSYSAVLSIMLFFKPINNWFYFDNKPLNFIWKLSALTLAAQVLTIPITVDHFHQLPLLFLFTNLLAVPLSSIILYGLIILCSVSAFPVIASLTGSIISPAIHFMNEYIEGLNKVPFAAWQGLSITFLQSCLLLTFIAAVARWLLEKYKTGFWLSLFALCGFITLRSISFIETASQHKLIVYNVPWHRAIDLVEGDRVHSIADNDLLQDEMTRNFHIQPSRILNRISGCNYINPNTTAFEWAGKRIVMLDSTVKLLPTKDKADVLILSHNPKVYINKLSQAFSIGQVVIDGSVPAWKARLWQKDCDSLHIPCFNTSEKGAFVMNME